MASFVPSFVTAQTIRKVTVAGITGAIGPTLIEALTDAGFEVQALTRRSATEVSALGNVRIVSVKYDDRAALEEILRGQDAVISVLGDTAGAVAAQQALIEVSAAVGVQRFVPSEFGSDTLHPRVRSFPFFAAKLHHQDLLKRLAEDNRAFSYSVLITGAFLDWGLSVVPFIVDVGNKKPQRFDGGDVPFSVTRVPTVAKAVISLLKDPDATKNQTLYVHDAVVTQNQLLACAERLNGGLAFSQEVIDMQLLEKEAWASYADPTADPLTWVFPFINISFWSREVLCAFFRNDNDLLGIEELCGTKLDAVVEEEVTRAITRFASTSDLPLVDSKAVDKAFEDGKNKLAGFMPLA